MRPEDFVEPEPLGCLGAHQIAAIHGLVHVAVFYSLESVVDVECRNDRIVVFQCSDHITDHPTACEGPGAVMDQDKCRCGMTGNMLEAVADRILPRFAPVYRCFNRETC